MVDVKICCRMFGRFFVSMHIKAFPDGNCFINLLTSKQTISQNSFINLLTSKQTISQNSFILGSKLTH